MNKISSHQSGLRWLVLDLNSFFASCEQQEQPALRGLPVVVAPMLAETTCAIAASYPAKAFGIKTGTPIYAARQLCPDVRVVAARPKLYVRYHHQILRAIEACIPVEKVLSIDEVACRLDRTQQTPAAAQALALAIKQRITAEVGACLTSSVGIASNVLLAKLASDMQKPDGLTLLEAQHMPQAIIHLPVTALSGIGRRMAARLAAGGIHDMAGLWAAESHVLRRLWGGLVGLRFHALLHGADLASPAHSRQSIGHEHVLAPHERRMMAAWPIMQQLLLRAAERLRREAFYCQRLTIHIKWQRPEGYWVKEQSFPETQDSLTLSRTLKRLWGLAPAWQPLRIGVVLSGLVPASAHQGDLFAAVPTPAPGIEKSSAPVLAAAIDGINDRYGRGTLNFGAAGLLHKDMGSKIAFQRVPDIREC